MRQGEGKIILGGALVGVAAFIGLGLIGFGIDVLAKWFAQFNLPIDPSSMSKLVFGIFSAFAVILITTGYMEVRDGVVVGLDRR